MFVKLTTKLKYKKINFYNNMRKTTTTNNNDEL